MLAGPHDELGLLLVSIHVRRYRRTMRALREIDVYTLWVSIHVRRYRRTMPHHAAEKDSRPRSFNPRPTLPPDDAGDGAS